MAVQLISGFILGHPAFQNDGLSIDVWRFIAGVGVGLELVAIDCYLAELTLKLRGRGFSVSTAIQFMSAPVGAILAWRMISGEHSGWLAGAGWRCSRPSARP